MRYFLIIAGLACLLGAAAARADETACGLPAPAGDAAMHLPHATAQHEHLDILALGSASTLGPGGQAQGSVAALLRDKLQAALPGRVITLRVLGHRGATAEELVGVLRAALAKAPADVVIWQTGTVEAIRRLPVAGFRTVVAEGLRVAQAAGADAILVDQPYSHRAGEKVDMTSYRAALRAAAEDAGASVFERYGLMRDWAASGQLDLDRTGRKDRAAAMARLHVCLVGVLAQQIQAGLAAKR